MSDENIQEFAESVLSPIAPEETLENRLKEIGEAVKARLREAASDLPELFVTGAIVVAYTYDQFYNHHRIPSPGEYGVFVGLANLIADPIAEGLLPALLSLDEGFKPAGDKLVKYFHKYYPNNMGRLAIEAIEALVIMAGSYFVYMKEQEVYPNIYANDAYTNLVRDGLNTALYHFWRGFYPFIIGCAFEGVEMLLKPAAITLSLVSRKFGDVAERYTDVKYYDSKPAGQ